MSSRRDMWRSHNDYYLRVATSREEPLEWRHPGKSFDGKMHSPRRWKDMPCWINDDLNDARTQTGMNTFRFQELRAEVDYLLEDASYGELTQEHPDAIVHTKKDAGRTRIDKSLMFLRLPEPFHIRGMRYRCRVYYSEPDMCDLLVSFGVLVKCVDDPQQNSAQNTRIQECIQRGSTWTP